MAKPTGILGQYLRLTTFDSQRPTQFLLTANTT